MSNQLIKESAREAKSLLNNKFFQEEIWACMLSNLDKRMLEVNIAKEPEVIHDIIRYRQLLHEFQSIALNVIKTGKAIEAKELKELEAQNKKAEQENKVYNINR